MSDRLLLLTEKKLEFIPSASRHGSILFRHAIFECKNRTDLYDIKLVLTDIKRLKKTYLLKT